MSEQGDPTPVQEFHVPVVCGLGNIGNTCYFNSGLQCLLNVPELVSALRWGGDQRSRRQREANSILRRRTPNATAFYHVFWETFKEMSSGQNLHIAPKKLVTELGNVNPQFEGFQQQDAPEMVNSTVGALEDATALEMSTEPLLRASGFLSENPELDEKRIEAIEDAASRRSVRVLQLMKNVNDENARLEPGKFIPPKLIRSAPFDVFKGYVLNETICSKCSFSSRVIESFSSISLAMPTYKQRLTYAKEQGHFKPMKKRTWNPLKLFCTCIASLLRACGCWEDSGSDELGPLTLHECLSIHFHEQHLKGSDKYKCLVCKSKQEAIHRSTILELPDTLILHLKRFEFGSYWTSKKSEYVAFPMSWAPALTNLTGSPTVVPPAYSPREEGESRQVGATPGHLDLAPFCSKLLPCPIPSTYTLTGIINHHGSFNGGHYTCYVKKDEKWALFNDHRVAEVDAQEVSDSQGYLFFYKKQAPLVETLEQHQLRELAQQYLCGDIEFPTTPTPTSSDRDEKASQRSAGSVSSSNGSSRDGNPGRVVYVSRLWLHRLAVLVNPGPIMNKLCYCDPLIAERCLSRGDQVSEDLIPPTGQARHFHASALWFYVPVKSDDYQRFCKLYGGGPAVDEAHFADEVARENKWLAAVAKSEGAASWGQAPAAGSPQDKKFR